MTGKLIGAHQPNFFPWLGYFHKIYVADQFVLLDNVQFPKGQAAISGWVNRVRLLIGGQPAWVTMPVVRAYHGVRTIAEMRIDDGQPWRRKLLRSIEINYRKAAFFDETFTLLTGLVTQSTDLVGQFNMHVIREIAAHMGIERGKFLVGSELELQGTGTDMLISAVRSAGGASYLSGGGADGYQENDKFMDSGLQLIFQEFTHPRYPQRRPEFVPGLSVVDALMNGGAAGTRQLLTEASSTVSASGS